MWHIVKTHEKPAPSAPWLCAVYQFGDGCVVNHWFMCSRWTGLQNTAQKTTNCNCTHKWNTDTQAHTHSTAHTHAHTHLHARKSQLWVFSPIVVSLLDPQAMKSCLLSLLRFVLLFALLLCFVLRERVPRQNVWTSSRHRVVIHHCTHNQHKQTRNKAKTTK